MDAIVAMYSVFHIPRAAHGRLYRCLASFLPAGGRLQLVGGASDWEGVEEDFHGAKMWWSEHAPPETRRLVEQAGFFVLVDTFLDTASDEHHHVVLAERTSRHDDRS